MELVGRPGGGDLGVPRSASEIPTERIFDADRTQVVRGAVASARPARGISNADSIALCLAAFALGIALTLVVCRQLESRASIPPIGAAPVAAPADPSEVAPRAPFVAPIIVGLPPPPAVAFTPTVLSPTARRPLTKPSARPLPKRQVRPAAADQAAFDDAPAAKPWVDPFAE
jgi:hypothetical protein